MNQKRISLRDSMSVLKRVMCYMLKHYKFRFNYLILKNH